jgi:branched-chain amino acid transport system substrate-binding protein
MMMKHTVLGLLAATLLLGTGHAQAQISDDVVRIGVLTDLTGVYADNNGPGTVIATQMAVEDFGGKVLGKPVEVIAADHQNKADIASSIARRWIDEGKVDVITSVANSAVALAVQGITRDKDRILLNTGAATSDFTGKACSPTGFGWTYDTYALASGTGKALVKQGGDTWYFLTADYAFGHALERDTSKFITEAGGKVIGSAKVPLSNTDFSSFLLQAQASGAKVIGLANAGVAKSGQRLAGLLVLIQDINSIGLKAAQGLVITDFGYWDMNDETRALNKRFMERHGKAMNYIQFNDYSATLHYLKAVQAAGTDEAKAVATKMKELPVNDPISKNVKIREDGRVMRDSYLMQVKSPEQSKGPWDFYTILATIPASESIRPLSEGGCPFIK